MGLDIDLDLNMGRGRQARQLTVGFRREVERSDLAALAAGGAESSTPPEPKKLSERHHLLARLLASGTSESEAAFITKYDPSRVSILKSSPAFQDLIAFYRRDVDTAFVGTLDMMAGLSRDALTILQDRIEESPDEFSVKELMSVVSDFSDRTGAPKLKQVEKTITHNLGDRLTAARERAKLARQQALNLIPDADVLPETSGEN